MLHGHNFVFRGVGGDFQAVGQGISFQQQGVVTGCGKGVIQAFEEAGALMVYGRSFSVHKAIREDYFAAEMLAYALVAEADAEERHLARESGDNFEAVAGLTGCAGAGRY